MTFCGDPTTHGPHEFPATVSGRPEMLPCGGVNREAVSETVVEKYVPDTSDIEAEDATEYKKITILIEDKLGVTIIHAGKASTETGKVTSKPYLPLDKAYLEFYPEIERVDFSFTPHTTDEFPAITIERKLNEQWRTE